MSLRLTIINFLMRNFERRALKKASGPTQIRQRMRIQAALFFRPPRKTPISREAVAYGQSSVSALKIGSGQTGALLYFHGGGFIFGSANTHRRFVAKLADDNDLAAYSIDYRLAPENPFPSAIDDALTAYHALLGRGFDPATITVAGDSAGGGLALSLLHRILALGLPVPRNLVVFSPLTDVTLSAASLSDNATSEVMLPVERVEEMRSMYITDDLRNPLASPLFGEFTGAPPVFITVGTTEILRYDSVAMAAKLRRAGVAVTLDIGENLPHVWPFFHGLMPEADATLRRVQVFLSGSNPRV